MFALTEGTTPNLLPSFEPKEFMYPTRKRRVAHTPHSAPKKLISSKEANEGKKRKRSTTPNPSPSFDPEELVVMSSTPKRRVAHAPNFTRMQFIRIQNAEEIKRIREHIRKYAQEKRQQKAVSTWVLFQLCQIKINIYSFSIIIITYSIFTDTKSHDEQLELVLQAQGPGNRLWQREIMATFEESMGIKYLEAV